MAGKSKKVLIAEDEKPLARALSLKLKSHGYDVTIAEDGVVLRELLASSTYDILLMDLMMPQHDGFALMAELKEKKVTMPVVILSNLSQEVDRVRAKEAGATDYFVKASTPLSEVIAYVKKIIG